ncbi:MAG: hypothetical protein SGILL_005702, partial [Bacillariaceae sp.]
READAENYRNRTEAQKLAYTMARKEKRHAAIRKRKELAQKIWDQRLTKLVEDVNNGVTPTEVKESDLPPAKRPAPEPELPSATGMLYRCDKCGQPNSDELEYFEHMKKCDPEFQPKTCVPIESSLFHLDSEKPFVSMSLPLDYQSIDVYVKQMVELASKPRQKIKVGTATKSVRHSIESLLPAFNRNRYPSEEDLRDKCVNMPGPPNEDIKLLSPKEEDKSWPPERIQKFLGDPRIVVGGEDRTALFYPDKSRANIAQMFEAIAQKWVNTCQVRETEAKVFMENIAKISAGASKKKTVPDITLDDLEHGHTDKWISTKMELLESLFSLIKVIEEDETLPSSVREDWERKIRTPFQVCGLAILSAGTRDDSLMRVYYALEKLGWFNYKFLSQATWKDMVDMQIVFLYCGANFWSEGPARLIGMAKRIEHFYHGKLPTTPEDWVTFDGVGWKVACLICQDGLRDPRGPLDIKNLLGVVPDTHVQDASMSFRLSKYTDEDVLGKDIQKWLPKKYWKVLNECFGGLAQVWEQATLEQQTKIESIAKNHGVYDALHAFVTKTVMPPTDVDPVEVVSTTSARPMRSCRKDKAVDYTKE